MEKNKIESVCLMCKHHLAYKYLHHSFDGRKSGMVVRDACKFNVPECPEVDRCTAFEYDHSRGDMNANVIRKIRKVEIE